MKSSLAPHQHSSLAVLDYPLEIRNEYLKSDVEVAPLELCLNEAEVHWVLDHAVVIRDLKARGEV